MRRRRECQQCGERFTTFETAELMLPRVIKFRQLKSKSDVIIRYHKQKIGLTIPDHAFKLTAPPGVPQRILTCP